ncbi:cutinase family protein [Nocardia asteroides]|uniref:cutinase family protein n=1 Tax=Nocardia asteroides TaxID=1824 RepID=UPI001E289EDF|nr:cutinase family protein [Nocardia asteroides]UGT62793.1 cutinase family protein [Nocardia asteroides]
MTPTTTGAALLAAVLTGAGIALTAPAAAAAPGCGDAELIMARGTDYSQPVAATWASVDDPTVGRPLDAAVRGARPELHFTLYNVSYPADTTGPRSRAIGAVDLVAHLVVRAAECPATRFVLAGYSQGAEVVSNALGMGSDDFPATAVVPPPLAPRIAALLLFASPIHVYNTAIPEPYAARTAQYCVPQDPVCNPASALPPDAGYGAHTRYGEAVTAAAVFAAERL